MPSPPLEPGDHLTREEFERRYAAMPEVKKAELIEGVVFMASAVRWKNHAGPHAKIITWLGVYEGSTPGTAVGDNGSVRLDLNNEPQPDATMIIDPKRGGQARISADDYIEGAPELVVEVAASSVSIDMNMKLRAYRRNNVREYVVWRVLDSAIDWFVLKQGRYDPLPLGSDGIYRSEVFPGLWLAAQAMLRADLASVLQTLQMGLATPEHGAFVARLQSQAKP